MRLLVLGGTGLLGCTLMQQAKRVGYQPISAARSSADVNLDLLQENALSEVLETVDPDLVINAAANVDLAYCEANPENAHRINTAPALELVRWGQRTGRYFVQISTDHFYDDGGCMQHDEQQAVVCVNEYARSKLGAEKFALASPNALVLRTSLAGFHADGRGFAAWALEALCHHKPLTLFDDFYGSVIDIHSFTIAMFDFIKRKTTGLYNLASSEVSSKKQFIHALAKASDIDLDWASTGSVTALVPRRARCLGLDVSRAEHLLGRTLPGVDDVAKQLVMEWKTMQ